MIISVDHGNKSIKTPNALFTSGLISSEGLQGFKTDYLTVHEVLELPYTARSEYVLYRWNDVFNNAEKIRSMVDRLRFQVECFNEALPYEAGQSYGDRAASQVRVIYRIS